MLRHSLGVMSYVLDVLDDPVEGVRRLIRERLALGVKVVGSRVTVQALGVGFFGVAERG